MVRKKHTTKKSKRVAETEICEEKPKVKRKPKGDKEKEESENRKKKKEFTQTRRKTHIWCVLADSLMKEKKKVGSNGFHEISQKQRKKSLSHESCLFC